MIQTSSFSGSPRRTRFVKSEPFSVLVTSCYYLNLSIFYLLLLLLFPFYGFGRNGDGMFVLGESTTPPIPKSVTTFSFNQSYIHHFYGKSSLALLSGTLRTYQRAACDDAWVNLKCPEATTISIQFSQYGRTAATPTLCGEASDPYHPYHSSGTASNNFTCYSQKVYQTIVSRCQKKAECKFQVNPKSLGGDPCPFARKFVEIAYKCRPGQFKSLIGCENELIQLTCNPNSRLAIYSANFGRTEYESIQCPQPTFVEEETCLASFATETVMNQCHGKRKCSVRAEASTFGRPCKPQSRNYLKIIHTCVPRKVLKRKFQGELELDETDDGMDESEEGESTPNSSILEHNSAIIPSSNHPFGARDPHSTQESSSESRVLFNPNHHDSSQTTSDDGGGGRGRDDTSARSSAVLNSDPDIHEVTGESHNGSNNHNQNNSQDIRFINLISQSMNAYAFIERNSHTFWLLVAISMLSVFLLLLFLLLIRLIYVRHKGNKKEKEDKKMKSSTIRRASGLSDIDELSLVLDPNEYVHLSTIQRNRSNPSRGRTSSFGGGGSGDDAGLAKNRVVRYSNSRNSMLGRQESDTSPRSFHQEHESDIHFFFG